MSEFDKIIGYEDIKAELARFASVLKDPDRYSRLGVTVPGVILLHGDPGLGKTLMAKCFIAETGCKVYTLRKEKAKQLLCSAGFLRKSQLCLIPILFVKTT